MKKRIIYSLFFFISMLIVSCSSNKENNTDLINLSANSNEEKTAGSSGETDKGVTPVEKINIDQRKVIKTGNLEFETADMANTRLKIGNAVTLCQGYISNEQTYSDINRINNVLVIRVPSQNFDKLLAEVSAGVKKIDSKNIDVSDVTEEFLDVQARLKTKKELEVRYLELLKKANKVGEILEIEREIGTLRADIESVEGRLKFMSDKIDFSTLNVTFYIKTAGYKTDFSEKFINGFGNGIKALIWFFVGLVNIWPFILITFVTIWLIRRHLRNKRNKKA